MDNGGLFLYDVVQPGRKRLTRTSVTRTLVGDPGSTYKYLGESTCDVSFLYQLQVEGVLIQYSINYYLQRIEAVFPSLG